MLMKTLADLQAIKEKMQGQIELRYESHAHTRITVSMGTCGIEAGARPVLTAFSDLIQQKKVHGVLVGASGCVGLCKYEPVVEVTTPEDGKITYVKVTPEKAAEIVEKHIIGKQVVKEYTLDSVNE